MKSRVLHRILPLVLLAFFNVLGGYANTNASPATSVDSLDYSFLQQSKNTHALFFEEIQAAYSFLEFKRNPINSKGLQENFYAKLPDAQQPSAKDYNPLYLQDIRKLLEHQIFPFHFYW